MSELNRSSSQVMCIKILHFISVRHNILVRHNNISCRVVGAKAFRTESFVCAKDINQVFSGLLSALVQLVLRPPMRGFGVPISFGRSN